MTAPRLKFGGIFSRDDAGDTPRLRVDLSGNVWLDEEDLAALAAMLADPVPQRERARQRADADATRRAIAEADRVRAERQRQETNARTAARARLKEAFPEIADELIGPDKVPTFLVVLVPKGPEPTYFSHSGLHTSDKKHAAHFATSEAAWAQVRALAPTTYAVEEARV